MTDTPNSERQKGGLGSLKWKDQIDKARDYARNKPGMALGALAALAIGIGLMRRR